MYYNKLDVWPKDRVSYYIETAVIILMAIFSMSLQYGRFDTTTLLSTQLGIRVFGTLLIWFANKFTLEYILQSKIDSNKVTQFLPFELTVASVAITSIIYLIFYPILAILFYLIQRLKYIQHSSPKIIQVTLMLIIFSIMTANTGFI